MPLPRLLPRRAMLFTAVVTLGFAPTARGTTLVVRPLDAMLRDADAVALISIPATPGRARWIDGRIVTDLDVTVLETLRGAVPVGPLTLRLPGGTVDAITQQLPGGPAFAPNTSWIVLLHRTRDGALAVFDLCLGQLPVALDPVTHAPVVRPAATADVTLIPDPRAAVVVATASPTLHALPAAGMPLERFAALVRALPR